MMPFSELPGVVVCRISSGCPGNLDAQSQKLSILLSSSLINLCILIDHGVLGTGLGQTVLCEQLGSPFFVINADFLRNVSILSKQ